jgi:DNA-binding NarL/FixJ family response regulator
VNYSIFVVTPIQIYREGVVALFGSSAGFSVVGSATRVRDSLVTGADAVLVDCSFMPPGVLAGYCRARTEQSPIIAFGVPDDVNTVLALLEAGATGYVADHAPSTEVRRIVLAVIEGNAVLSTAVSLAMLERLRTRAAMTVARPFHSLTVREVEVAELMGEQKSNKEIAAALGISVHTVKVHVHHVIQKLELDRRGVVRDTLERIGVR